MSVFFSFLKSIWTCLSLMFEGELLLLITHTHSESQCLFYTYYSHSRPVSWCPPGIFWGLPAGGPGHRAGGRASSHRCRRTHNRPLSSPPSPSHLPSACTDAHCQGSRRRQAGPILSVRCQRSMSCARAIWQTHIHAILKKQNKTNASFSVVHCQVIEQEFKPQADILVF